jgi:molybdopterin-binding protein
MMTSYAPSQAAALLGVSADTIRRWCDEGRLRSSRSDGGHRHIDGRDLARHLREQASSSFETETPYAQSARNRFTGIVTRVEHDTLTAIVEIHAGPHRIMSLMTREAADELGVEPGDLATAVVKATSVIVEVPRS